MFLGVKRVFAAAVGFLVLAEAVEDKFEDKGTLFLTSDCTCLPMVDGFFTSVAAGLEMPLPLFMPLFKLVIVFPKWS